MNMFKNKSYKKDTMSKKNKEQNPTSQKDMQKKLAQEPTNENLNNEEVQETTQTNPLQEMEEKINQLEAKVAELEDLKLRQMAEFDNFRRRTNKEKLELLQNAGERIFVDMLPLVDDFERAKDAMAKTDDIDSVRQGIDLIYNKFIGFLASNDVKVIQTDDADFNTDLHEAITTFAAGEDKKGKVIDCTQKGYTLGEKVIRFSKVVVGE